MWKKRPSGKVKGTLETLAQTQSVIFGIQGEHEVQIRRINEKIG